MDIGEKVKKFFEKKKSERKFNKAGPGHKLSESTSKPVVPQDVPVASRGPPTAESQKAALAALNRAAGTSGPMKKSRFNYDSKQSLSSAISSIASQENSSAPLETSDSRDPASFAVQGVFFTCPFLGNQILPKEEWKNKLEEFLYEQLEYEKGLTACLILCTLNKPIEKVESCMNTLALYLGNILSNPDDPKYRKIRLENKVFKERVHKMKGSVEFLEAAGFQKQTIANADGVEEEFFVYIPDPPEIENLEMLVDGLKNAERIQLSLDRNVQVLHPSQAVSRMSFPDDFYALSREELKREQQLKKDRIESMMELKTKAMRQREEMQERRKYKYAVIRVRFPSDILLQGTFSTYEKLADIKQFVKENLENPCDSFSLFMSTGDCLDNDTATLLELGLVPATVLTFRWKQGCEDQLLNTSLKSEIMVLLQPLS